MRHAREDYNLRIQDIAKRIPDNEPVFLLRGQDPSIQACMRLWIELAEKNGSDPVLIQKVKDWIPVCDEWQQKVRVKPSDYPTEPQPPLIPTVKIGQLWEGTDFRNQGQQVRVQIIQGPDALCVLERRGRIDGFTQRVERQQRIPLSKFNPDKQMGYKLVEDVP